MRIAREGLRFILPPLFGAFLSLWLGWWILAIFFFMLGAVFSFFFRDPKRIIPSDDNLLLAPADGRVVKIETIASHPSFPSSVTRISIFLSLFDVHITRAPLSGIIQEIEYKKGSFVPAHREEASLRNEHNLIFLKGSNTDILLKQMAGIFARRIKCFVKKSDRIEGGQKIGLIYFGSRVEIFFPSNISLKVCLNQRVKAGQSVIGEVNK